MAGKSVNVSIVADAKEFSQTIRNADRQLVGLGTSSIDADGKVSKSFKGISEAADSVASKGAQVAGGLSGIGGTLTDMGIPAGKTLTQIGTGLQFAADAGDVVAGTLDSVFGVAGKVKDMAKAVGLFGAAQDAAAVATDAEAASMDALGVSEGIALGPMLLIIAAIALFVGGIVLLWKKNEGFRNLVTKVWNGIKAAVGKVASWFITKVPAAFDKVKNAASKVFGWIKSHWKLLLSILTGPIGAAVIFIVSHWNTIKTKTADAFNSVRDKIKTIFGTAVSWVRDKVSDVVGAFTGIGGKIGHKVSGMFDGIKEAFRSAVNWIIRAWNGLHFTLPTIDTHIPGIGKVGGFTLSTPDIPQLANGGIVNRPTLALIGEAGPEAVVPLSRYNGGGGNTYHINVTAPVGSSSVDIGREITRHIDAFERAGGRRRG